MISTNRIIVIRNGKSKINEPIVVYRGDYELKVTFTILNNQFEVTNNTNLIETENSAFGQLAILTPYGGNIFTSMTECTDGTVSFLLAKEMLDQIEEVGLYSFQIRLFDYNKESRVSIPPVEYGMEVREPIASEDHDNTVDNAIVGYSIARVVNLEEENIGDTFDEYGNYNKTEWGTGDRISKVKLNKIEDAIDKINDNEMNNVETLNKRINNNFNILDSTKADVLDINSKVWSMANMGQDVKEAMSGGSVAVVGEDTILAENIVDKQVTANKIANTTPCKNIIDKNAIRYGYYYQGNTGKIIKGTSESGLNCITPLIPCIPGTEYYRFDGSAGSINTVFFDSSKTYIGRVEGTMNTAFIVMENASYMAFSFKYNYIDKVMVHEGSTGSTYEKYAVICNDYRVNELGISDVWLYHTEYLDIDRGVDGSYILNVSEGLQLYLTNSYGPQKYVDIPAGIYTLSNNMGWVFNYNTKEFTVRKMDSSRGYADITEGEILLLKVTKREISAGRLKHYFCTLLSSYKLELQSFVFRSLNGLPITQTRGDEDKRDITLNFPTTGQLQFIFNSGYRFTHNIYEPSNGRDIISFTLSHNDMLIYNCRKKEISLIDNNVLGDNLYQLRFDEFLLAFNEYGTIVDGLLLPYISSTFDLQKTNVLSVYDRYYETSRCTLVKADNTFTFTVPLDNSTPWRVYVLRTNITGNYTNPRMSYISYIPEGDPIVDPETSDTIADTKATFVLPHNGMLLLNIETKKFYTELMTDARCISFGGTNDLLLLLNIEGQLVGGELARAFNDRILKKDMENIRTSIDSGKTAKYDMGRFKFKFDVDPGGSYISSESLVGDELWVFPVSNDEGTNFVKATRYKMDFENNTATKVGSFNHNWGHVNSSAYNPLRDAIICGNGSGSYELMGQIFIFENASSFKDRTEVNRSEAITIDVQEWGYKANVIWGEYNMGRGDICYVITNDAQNIRKLQLGMGSNNLGNGTMLSDKTDYQFNGTYQVLGTWTLPRIDVVQGSNYENGALYIGLGHNTAWYTKNYLNDDGSVTYKTYKEKFYNADGTQLYCNMQGITVTDKYVIIGLQGGNLYTNQIHVYYR